MNTSAKKGFTIVEMMIVVFIISILAAIAIPSLLRNQIAANEASAQASLRVISIAMENYAMDQSVYPASLSTLISSTPPYLTTNYFNGIHYGYSFSESVTDSTYSVTARPSSSAKGSETFTIRTGGVLTIN